VFRKYFPHVRLLSHYKVQSENSLFGDTETERKKTGPADGYHQFLAPFQGAELFVTLSGGLRFTPTTGYYLPALQAESITKLWVSVLILSYIQKSLCGIGN